MLYSMSTFMCGHGSRCDTVAIVNITAEVYRMCGRIIMIGQMPIDLRYRNIVYSILLQHTHGNIPSCKAIRNGNFRITFEFALQCTLYRKAN